MQFFFNHFKETNKKYKKEFAKRSQCEEAEKRDFRKMLSKGKYCFNFNLWMNKTQDLGKVIIRNSFMQLQY